MVHKVHKEIIQIMSVTDTIDSLTIFNPLLNYPLATFILCCYSSDISVSSGVCNGRLHRQSALFCRMPGPLYTSWNVNLPVTVVFIFKTCFQATKLVIIVTQLDEVVHEHTNTP